MDHIVHDSYVDCYFNTVVNYLFYSFIKKVGFSKLLVLLFAKILCTFEVTSSWTDDTQLIPTNK